MEGGLARDALVVVLAGPDGDGEDDRIHGAEEEAGEGEEEEPEAEEVHTPAATVAFPAEGEEGCHRAEHAKDDQAHPVDGESDLVPLVPVVVIVDVTVAAAQAVVDLVFEVCCVCDCSLHAAVD